MLKKSPTNGFKSQLSVSYRFYLYGPTYLTVLRVRRQQDAQMTGSVAAFLNSGLLNNVNGSSLRMLHRALPLNGS